MSNVIVVAETQVIDVGLPSQEINVDPVSQSAVVVTSASSSVNVTSAGPQGPPGFGAGFNFTQSSDSDVWTINHNLGHKPLVQTFTVGGLEVVGEIHHISNNQVTVSFTTPMSGSARLN